MTPHALAAEVALRVDDVQDGICPAWIESADRRCGKPATVGLLCARHHKVAERRLAARVAKDASAREAFRARREAQRPAALERLAAIESRIAHLSGEPTTDNAVVNIPRTSKQWARMDARLSETARLHRERERLLWAREAVSA